MINRAKRIAFDRTMLPHIDRAYTLAYWLLAHKQDAEDAVQLSYLKAFKAFDSYSGGNSAGWVFKIVRNTCLNMLNQRNRSAKIISLDGIIPSTYEVNKPSLNKALQDTAKTPEQLLSDQQEQRFVWQGINALSLEFREIIVLREFMGLDYRDIAETIDIPIGTVMSRLARARAQLRKHLVLLQQRHTNHEL